LLRELVFQALFLCDFVELGLAELLLKALEVSFCVEGAIWVRVGLLIVRLGLLRSLLFLLFDQEAHFATLVFKYHQLLVLRLHSLLVFALLKL